MSVLKKILVAAVAVACLGAVAFVVVTGMIDSQPMNLIANAFEKTVNKAQDGALAETVSGVFGGGSIEISGNIGKIAQAYSGADDMDLDADFSIKLYADIEDAMLAMISSLKVEGTELIDLGAYIDEENIAVDSDALLDQTYGVSLKDLADNFDSSVFGENGKYSLGISSEDVEQFLEAQNTYVNFSKDFDKIAERVYKVASKSIMKNAEVGKSKGSLTFGGKTVKTTDVTISFDEKALSAIIVDVLKYIKDDEEVKDFVNEYGEIFFDAVDVEEFSDNIDALIDEYEEIGDDSVDVDITISISRSSKEIVGVDYKVKTKTKDDADEYNSTYNMTFTCGPTWKNVTEAKLSMKTKYSYTADGEKSYESSDDLVMTYSVNENTKDSYSAKLTLKNDNYYYSNWYDGAESESSGKYVADIDWDKSSGDLKVKLSESGDDSNNSGEIIFTGNLTVDGSKTTLVLQSLKIDEEKHGLGDITVTLNTNEKAPSIPKYKDVLTMSEDEVDKLIGNIGEAAEMISERAQELLGDGFFGGYDDDYGYGGDYDYDYDWE